MVLCDLTLVLFIIIEFLLNYRCCIHILTRWSDLIGCGHARCGLMIQLTRYLWCELDFCEGICGLDYPIFVGLAGCRMRLMARMVSLGPMPSIVGIGLLSAVVRSWLPLLIDQWGYWETDCSSGGDRTWRCYRPYCALWLVYSICSYGSAKGLVQHRTQGYHGVTIKGARWPCHG